MSIIHKFRALPLDRTLAAGRSSVVVGLAIVSIAFASFSHLSASENDEDNERARVSTIVGLTKISQVGSTENILDANGKKITVDADPYMVAMAPDDLSANLKEGDLLVSNLGLVKGVTIVKFTPGQATGRLFNNPNAGVLGPIGLAFDNGKLLVANSRANNLLVLNADGTLFTTITSGLFHGPWGIAAGNRSADFDFSDEDGRQSIVSFFVTNKFDAKILRVDVKPQGKGVPLFTVVQVGQFAMNGPTTKIDLHWLRKLKVGKQTLQDVLLATDPGNRIVAFPGSSTLQGTGKGTTLFQGAPLNQPAGLTINPINGDAIVSNLMDNNLVEVNLTTGKAVGVKQVDPAAVNAAGDGSALFGLVATKDEGGNLLVYYIDDNTNSLNMLSVK